MRLLFMNAAINLDKFIYNVMKKGPTQTNTIQ